MGNLRGWKANPYFSKYEINHEKTRMQNKVSIPYYVYIFALTLPVATYIPPTKESAIFRKALTIIIILD